MYRIWRERASRRRGCPHVGRARVAGTAPVVVVAMTLAAALAPPVALAGGPGRGRHDDPVRSAARGTMTWLIYAPRRDRDVGRDSIGAEMPEHHLLRLTALHSAMRYAEALDAADAMVACAPDRPLAHYNRACLLARLRRPDEALAALDEAVTQGWRDVAHTSIDSDLAALRNADAFQAVLARMRRLHSEEAITPSPLRADDGSARLATMGECVPPLLERYRVPGAIVAVVRDGELAGLRAFGAQDRAGRTPMTVDTPFRLRAPGHLVTLVAAARLDEAAKLRLPDLLVRAEELRLAREKPPAYRRATPLHLRTPAAEWQARLASAPRRGERLAAWPAHDQTDETRKMLRLAVAIAGRDEFPDVCRMQVLEPLGMSQTRVGPAVVSGGPPCRGHSQLGSPLPPASGETPDATVTVAGDLVRLMTALFRPAGKTVLAPDSIDLIIGAAELEFRRLGFAVHADETAEGMRVQVADVDGGVGCLLRWYPDTRDGVVVLFNAETGDEAALRIAHALLGGI